MMNSIQGADSSYHIIETMMEKKTSTRGEDMANLKLELTSEISNTLIEKGFLTKNNTSNKLHVSPKGIKLFSILEDLNQLFNK